jgi:hypothetical protein
MIEAQHFDMIDCGSGGMLFGGLTYISGIRDTENPQCSKIVVCQHCEYRKKERPGSQDQRL